jgi:hypothetical protein
VEWRSPNFQSFEPLDLWLTVLLLSALSFGWRLPLTRTVMLVLLLHMALRHVRYSELLGFAAPLLAAPVLASQLARDFGGRQASSIDRGMEELAKPASASGLALAGGLVAAISAAMLYGGVAHQAADIAPRAALSTAEAHHVKGPVLNDYAFGGYLIFSGIAPFIDGRAELYGDAFIERYVRAMTLQDDQLPQLLSEYAITWTLLDPERPAVFLLDRLPGWRRLYTDDIAVVHVRDR